MVGTISVCQGLEQGQDSLRRQLLTQAREAARKNLELETSPNIVPANFDATWSATLKLYDSGRLIAVGSSGETTRTQAIKIAGENLRDQEGRLLTLKALQRGRLLLTLIGPRGLQSMIEYRGRALEVVGDVTAMRELTPQLLAATIKEQKEYLLRQIDRTHNAFFKLYDAANDRSETRLRTTYTASGLWTLLQMNDQARDPRVEALIEPMANFLLSMQVVDGAQKGAFHYSFEPDANQKQMRFVVGTTSKSIFTLLELHRRTGAQRYLDAAQLAGHWLAAQVRRDGRVVATTVWSEREKRWLRFGRESVLYNSETLSALSRLQLVSPLQGFDIVAKRIADRLLEMGEVSAFFVGDDYRRPNNISTSWLTMAFLDYVKISDNPRFITAIFTSAHLLSKRQIRDVANALDLGRYQDTWASSGNGWLNEVMVEVVKRCRVLKRRDCKIFEQDLLRTSRWLIQNTYRAENSFHIANPARARGGAIRDSVSEAVRTDAVCHAGNSLIGVLELMRERARLNLPEAGS